MQQLLPLCLNKLRSHTCRSRMTSVLATTLVLLLGFLVFWLADPQDLSAIDALYLTIVTISTVGYGDISPSNDAGDRVFTVCYVLVGSGYAFVQLANVFGGVLGAFTDQVKRLISHFDRTKEATDTTGDGQADTHTAGHADGANGKAHDIDGDGIDDFIEPPAALVFWVQELLPALVLLMLLQLVSAAVFVVLMPELDFGSALYHCFITATTVGYGDVSINTPEARLFACLHILVSVSWLAALLSSVDSLRTTRDSQLEPVQ